VLEIYWGCFVVGALFAVITVIFGDFLGNIFDGLFDFLSLDHLDFFHPMVIVGGITAFGGAGLVLTRHTSLEALPVAMLSLMTTVLLSFIVYFAYVRPMKGAESSTGFSVHDLVGKIGEVIVPIPARGYGEVFIKVGAGNTNQIAASSDGEDIPAGTRVVVAEARDGALYVFRYEQN
jgi:membrane protein implicated in regulation of membrane protease activity